MKLNLRPETKATLDKLTPEGREGVMKAASNLVKTKTEKILQAKAKLIAAAKDLQNE